LVAQPVGAIDLVPPLTPVSLERADEKSARERASRRRACGALCHYAGAVEAQLQVRPRTMLVFLNGAGQVTVV